jgi:hypothetical protein
MHIIRERNWPKGAQEEDINFRFQEGGRSFALNYKILKLHSCIPDYCTCIVFCAGLFFC